MIAQAVDFADRVEAVEFAFSQARPDLSTEARTRQTILYALPAGDLHAIVPSDVFPEMEPKPRPGMAESPIWTVRRHGELIGAAVCSCAVRDLPLRIMAGAVREDFRDGRVARDFMRHIIESVPVVGAAVPVDRKDRRVAFTRWGLTHWYEAATGDIVVGFSQPVDPREGLLYAAPIATDQEIAQARARFASERQPRRATIPPRSSHTR